MHFQAQNKKMEGDTHTDVTFPAAFIELHHQQVCRYRGTVVRFVCFRQTFFFFSFGSAVYLYRHSRMYSIDVLCTSVSKRRRRISVKRREELLPQFPYDHHDRDGRHTAPFPFRSQSQVPTKKKKTGLWGWPRRTLKSTPPPPPPPRVFPCFISFCRDFYFISFNFFSFHD